MQGLAVALAAVAAAGRRAGQRARARRSWSPPCWRSGPDVRVLQAQGVRRPPEELLSELVALRGHGTTDLAAGLREAVAPARRGGGRRAARRAALRLPAHRGRRPGHRARRDRPAARARAAGRGRGRGGGRGAGRRVVAGGPRRCAGWRRSPRRSPGSWPRPPLPDPRAICVVAPSGDRATTQTARGSARVRSIRGHHRFLSRASRRRVDRHGGHAGAGRGRRASGGARLRHPR